MSSGLRGYSRPYGDGTVMYVRDSTANDSDKTFTVPAGKVWELRRMAMDLTTSADVGNRIMVIRVTDAAGAIIWQVNGTTNVAASQSGIMYVGDGAVSTCAYKGLVAGGTPTVVAYVANFSPMLLPAGYTVRIWDGAAVAAGADDLIAELNYVEYDA